MGKMFSGCSGITVTQSSRGGEGGGRVREAGSLRWREAGEKFKRASFCYLLLLTSSQRNEPKNVS